MKLRFSKATQEAVVLFCFECRMLFVRTAHKTTVDDFDPAAPALVDIVKQLFPKVALIQSLT